ncbi:hypothetical protein [Mycobacterium sp. NPDC050441]|uniref:hypothetical protein n=1 Tax=Mycobacterium sp. NPDC050441 TaxID=3155403 RepID=UPI0033E7C878
MAVRPLITTGAALLSAGALVAATPALFVPRDQITIAAPTSALAPTRLTQEQVDLLALSLQGAWQSFTQGYGGIYIPGKVPEIDPVTGEIVTDADGNPVMVDAPGDCTAEGAVCQKGFTGLAYYLSDNILPLGDVDNIFFEGGFTELAHQAIRTVAVAIDAVDPTGRLDLTKRVDDFFEGGATQLVGNLLLDNLPQDGYAYGLTNSFFFGYGDNSGVYAAFTYVVDAIAQGTPTPTPNLINPLDSGPSLLSTEEENNSDTMLLAKKDTGLSSTTLPGPGSLLTLSTKKFESPFKDLLKLPFKAPAADETKLVTDLDATEQDVVKGPENPVEGGIGAIPLGGEIQTPEAPKFEMPKAPEFKVPELKVPEFKVPELKTPEFKAPELKPDLTPKGTVKDKEPAVEGDTNTGVNTKTGNKVTPPILFGDGGPKGESNGSKFLKKLDKAIKDATGAGKDNGTDGGGDK